MTLIVARTSLRSALMVSDRRVTADGDVFDPDANKNVLFADRNAVVAIGYTGMAYIGSVPTDQWIAGALTGLDFPEGRHGPGSVPMFMTTRYEPDYWGRRVRAFRERLNAAGVVVLPKYRSAWRRQSFDLLMTGFEWNHGEVTPYLAALSKPRQSEEFELWAPPRYWYVPPHRQFPFQICMVPAENVTDGDLASVKDELSDSSVDQAAVLEGMIRRVSGRLAVVGSDTMSISIPPPIGDEPTISVRYAAVDRGEATLMSGDTSRIVPAAFTPWIISSGAIHAPSILVNAHLTMTCGPYRVVAEAPAAAGGTRAVSGQARLVLH